jgi:hypothetical protein
MTLELSILLVVALFDIFLTFWCFVILEQRDIALARIRELEFQHMSDLDKIMCAARHSCGCYIPEDDFLEAV